MDKQYNLIAVENISAIISQIYSSSYSEENLIAISNKGTYKRAVKDLDTVGMVTLNAADDGIIVQTAESEVHLKSNLADSTCNCSSKVICRHIIAAAVVLSEYAADNFTEAKDIKQDVLDTEENAAIIKEIVPDYLYLDETQNIVSSMLSKGLMNCGETEIEVLSRLSVKGNTMHKNVAKLCHSAASDIKNMLDKNADFVPYKTCMTLSRIYNTVEAVKASQNDNEKLAVLCDNGADYEACGNGEFVCLGAYPWHTKSGYAGVTAMLFECNKHEFFTYSSSISTQYDSTNNAGSEDALNKAYSASVHWQNDVSIKQLTKGFYTLHNFKADKNGRISSSKQTVCILKNDIVTAQNKSLFDTINETAFSIADEYDYFKNQNQDRFFVLDTEYITDIKEDKISQTISHKIVLKSGDYVNFVIDNKPINRQVIQFMKMNSDIEFSDFYLVVRSFGKRLYPVCKISNNGLSNLNFL